MGASNSKMAEEQPQRNDVAKFALEMAKIAEQAERYEDMVAEMKKIVDDGVKGDELSVEERNLISVGYKNMMSVRRTAWRTIQQVEEEEARKNSTPGAAENLATYKQNIASEVFDLIDQVCANIVKVYTDESSPLKATKEEVLVSQQAIRSERLPNGSLHIRYRLRTFGFQTFFSTGLLSVRQSKSDSKMG